MLPRGVVRGALRDLRLGFQRRERRAQLVRCVGGESPFVLDQAPHPVEKSIEAAHQGNDLSRRSFERKNAKVVRLSPLHFMSEPIEGLDRAADA